MWYCDKIGGKKYTVLQTDKSRGTESSKEAHVGTAACGSKSIDSPNLSAPRHEGDYWELLGIYCPHQYKPILRADLHPADRPGPPHL